MASSLSFSTELTQISSQTSTAQPITETMQQNSNKADGEKVSASRETDLNLPPADGGKHAWLFLAGCFVFEALIWGFPFSFGVFQSFYTTHPPFMDHPNGIAIIGTCSTGIMYLFAPVSLYALETWPSVRRLSSIVGLVIVVTALIGSSFSTQVWHLILTQGVLYAIGGSLLYSPTMFYLDEWFIKKKGLAFGIMWAGVGTSGLIFPFLLTHLLTTYSFRTTLRIWSLTLAILCTPLIYFIKPRLPPTTTSTSTTATSTSTAIPKRKRKRNHTFLLSRAFIILQLSNVVESLGFFLPAIYIPSYITQNQPQSTSPHTNDTTAPLLLALLNGFSVLGAIAFGYLCDRLHVTTVIYISSIGATLSVFVFWGLGNVTGDGDVAGGVRMPMLIVFVCTYGVFAGGFSAIWTGMMGEVQVRVRRKNDLGEREVQRDGDGDGQGEGEGEVGMGTLMGLFSAGRGTGAVLSGPVSEVLLRGHGTGKYGGVFGQVVVFTGVSAAVGGLVCLFLSRGVGKRVRA